MDDPKPEILRAYIEAQQCWWCGKGGWKSLPQHTCKAHGISAAELRELAYMYKSEPVTSKELRDEMSQRTLARKDDWRGSLEVRSRPVRVHSTKGKDELRARTEVLREKYKDIRIEKTSRPHKCRICGTVIPKSTPRLCSEECRLTERHQAKPPEMGAKISATRKERIAAGLITFQPEAPKAHPCPICGTWIPRSVPATCSPECAKALTRQKTGKPHPCPVCGTILPTAKPITCSPECRKVIRQRTTLISAATRKRLSAENPDYRAELAATQSKVMKRLYAEGKLRPPIPRKPHPCPVCGTIVPKVHPTACSPECRRVLLQRAQAKACQNRTVKVPREDYPKVAGRYWSGESTTVIAAEYSVTPRFIRAIAKKCRTRGCPALMTMVWSRAVLIASVAGRVTYPCD